MKQNLENSLDETPEFYRSILESKKNLFDKVKSQKNIEENLSFINPLIPYSLNDEHFLCKCCNTNLKYK